MSVLTTIQYVCERTNVPSPATVLGNTDAQVTQMLRLLEEEGTDLSKRGDWQGIVREATHTTLALEDQGAIATIAASGFRYSKNQTFWDRTNNLPILGPLSEQQFRRAVAISEGDLSVFVTRPISAAFLLLAAVVLVAPRLIERWMPGHRIDPP